MAAAKLHMNYLLGNLLPSFAIVDDAEHHDSVRALAVTSNLGDGDILVHLLLRYLKFLSKWKLSFSRLAGVIRAGIWVRRKVIQLLEMYGTAGGWKLDEPKPKPLYLQGFLPFTTSPVGQ